MPEITKLSTAIWWGWGVHSFPTIYNHMNPNPVAAVPSLHAAYPTLDLLFVWRLFGWRFGLPFAVYPLSVWVGVVYMGEHYVVDVLLGILYAVVIFFAYQYAARHVAARRHLIRAHAVRAAHATGVAALHAKIRPRVTAE
jgi:membrane-associated phospholipid phosphatase